MPDALARRDDALLASTSQLDGAIAAWLNAKAGRSGSAKTLRAYADTLAAFRAVLEGAGLDLDSEPRAIGLAAQGWAGRDDPAPATFNQRLAILSSFYVYACKHELLPCDNPIARVERRSVADYGTARSMDRDDLKRHLAAIDRSTVKGKRDYALIAVYLATGRRVAEVAALRWSHLQTTGKLITLHFPKTKGGKVASDVLSASVSAVLLAYLHDLHGPALGGLAPDTPLWTSLSRNPTAHGTPLSTQAIADICKRRLGVSKVHTLRHTFARAMEDSGAKVSEIQARLGHSSLATTGRYLAALRRADNPYGDALADLFGLTEAPALPPVPGLDETARQLLATVPTERTAIRRWAETAAASLSWPPEVLAQRLAHYEQPLRGAGLRLAQSSRRATLALVGEDGTVKHYSHIWREQ